MRLDPEVENLITEAVTRVGETWARALPLPCRIDPESIALVERDAFFRTIGHAACVGRSPFIAEGKGIGGWVLAEAGADRLARGVLNLPPPPQHGTTTFGGPIEDGIRVLHGLFLDGWNQGMPNDWRLNDDIESRLTERVHGLGTREVPAPAFPWLVTVNLEVAGFFCQLGIFLRPDAVAEAVPDHAPPTALVPWECGVNPPVAFVDPTGTVVRWLMDEIRAGRLVAKRSDAAAPASATVTIGGCAGVPPAETLVIAKP